MTLVKLRDQIAKKKKKIAILECKKKDACWYQKEKIQRLIEVEKDWIRLAEKEYDALIQIATTPPPVPHTVSNKEERNITLGVGL